MSGKVDLTTAIVDTIQSLAWPAAVFGGVWLLRREIRALLERISQIKYKDLEIGIREGLGRTREVLSSSSALEEPRQPLAAVEDKKDVAALMNLAHGSPRNAIIESWRLLQDLRVEVAKGKGHDFLSLPVAMPYALGAAWFLHSEKLIPDSVAAAIQNLGARQSTQRSAITRHHGADLSENSGLAFRLTFAR